MSNAYDTQRLSTRTAAQNLSKRASSDYRTSTYSALRRCRHGSPDEEPHQLVRRTAALLDARQCEQRVAALIERAEQLRECWIDLRLRVLAGEPLRS